MHTMQDGRHNFNSHQTYKIALRGGSDCEVLQQLMIFGKLYYSDVL